MRTNNYKKRNFRRVTFTLSTGYIDISQWEKLSDLLNEVISFIRVRGGSHIAWMITDTDGVGSVSFKPNYCNVNILKDQIERLYPEVTVFVKEIGSSKTTIEEESNEAE